MLRQMTGLGLVLVFGGCALSEDIVEESLLLSGDEGECETDIPPRPLEVEDLFSGDPCTACSGSFGATWSDHERNGGCYDDRWTIVDRLSPVEAAPRADAMWTDCAALEDGRTGERCKGQFACYREIPCVHDDSVDCLERVGCNVKNGEWTLTRRIISDIPGTRDATNPPHTGCENLDDVDPLDKCEGEFLCAGVWDPLCKLNHEYGECELVDASLSPWKGATFDPVSRWVDQNVFYFSSSTEFTFKCNCDSNTNPRLPLQYQLAWCDGEKIHLLSDNFSNVEP